MKQFNPPKQKIIFVLTLFALLFTGILKSQGQTNSGISLSWNIGVGCQSYSEDRKEVFFEEIIEGECIVCPRPTPSLFYRSDTLDLRIQYLYNDSERTDVLIG